MKLEHSLTPYTKINSKWIKDIDIRPDTIKLLEENIGQTLSNINSSIFSDLHPRVMTIKAKINKCASIKFKGQLKEWEEIFANEATDKGLISKIYKHLLQLNTKKQTTPSKNGQKI